MGNIFLSVFCSPFFLCFFFWFGICNQDDVQAWEDVNLELVFRFSTADVRRARPFVVKSNFLPTQHRSGQNVVDEKAKSLSSVLMSVSVEDVVATSITSFASCGGGGGTFPTPHLLHITLRLPEKRLESLCAMCFSFWPDEQFYQMKRDNIIIISW